MGYIDTRFGCATGSRAVYLHGPEKQKANFKFILEDGAKKAPVRPNNEITKVRGHHHSSDFDLKKVGFEKCF